VQADLPALQDGVIIDSGYVPECVIIDTTGIAISCSSAFDVVLDWLEQLPPTQVTLDLIDDIKVHMNLGRGALKGFQSSRIFI